MKTLPARLAGPLIGLALFASALWVLHQALAEYRYQDVTAYFRRLPYPQLLAALLGTALSYLVTTGYDWLALRYIRRPLPWPKVGFAALLSYAFSNSVGLSVLTSSSLRFRLYSSWGLTTVDIARIVVFTTLTLWLGILTVGGGVLALVPLDLGALPWLNMDSRLLGFLLLIPPAAYLLLGMLRRLPLRLGHWELPMVRPRLALPQLAVGALDWVMASLVLYILLPASGTVSFGHILGVFLVAQIAGLLSHIPGGLGVFESLVLLMLQRELPAADLLGALLAYRLVYYLLPLALAAIVLGLYELRHYRERVLWLPRVVGPWAPVLLPHVFALLALISGAVLLFSAATPAVEARLVWLHHRIPLSVLEISHFISSLVGMSLLLLARGLQRRLDAAWLLAVVFLIAGITASLLKGADYEEAIILSVLLAGLLPSRRQFYRRASLFGERFTPGWLAAIAVVLLCSVWLGFFSYKHIEYSNELWWDFSFSHQGGAPRFLRAMVGAMGVALFFGVAKLLRPAPFEPTLPGPEEKRQAHAIAAAFPRSYAHLALLGDKALLFNADHSAFLMYGVEGRAWVAMGDPVAATERERRELAWQFRELCERHGGWPVFYQVHPDNLGLYVELGLTLLKFGEEARVPLATFSLDGKSRKTLRNGINRLERDGYRFELVDIAAVPALLPQLRVVSNAWLGGKSGGEKGFSLGFFDEDYLRAGPIAVVRRDAEVVAFANLWRGGGEELSVDLMRYHPDSVQGVMDYLFIRIMLWGREQGFAWFNLGMAPLSGLQNRSLAPLWNRFGALVFGRGEAFYNFRGLHQYKDKFDPRWEARYLAAPGGMMVLPRVLADLTALIARGYKEAIGQ
ncbi:MAG: bifunctional lysylphosphatidylglycerol flippase/synthetase MprF [Candidatus Competibacteraceae bacterium]|nr:MAG: bifunctional lysylphosphatidylglycerol flippase/synthetase MprF [Candidatus Competibacteraceae bacterium]